MSRVREWHILLNNENRDSWEMYVEAILEDMENMEAKVEALEQQVNELSVRLAVALQALKETEREHDGA